MIKKNDVPYISANIFKLCNKILFLLEIYLKILIKHKGIIKLTRIPNSGIEF